MMKKPFGSRPAISQKWMTTARSTTSQDLVTFFVSADFLLLPRKSPKHSVTPQVLLMHKLLRSGLNLARGPLHSLFQNMEQPLMKRRSLSSVEGDLRVTKSLSV